MNQQHFEKKSTEKSTDKKRTPFKLTLIILILCFIWWFNNFTISVHTEIVHDDRINSEITIVHISDLHSASFGRNNANLIAEIKRQKPDIITVTGDMYTSNDSNGEETAQNLLTKLTEIAPVYYVNGEHDLKKSFSETLSESGVNVLNYKDEVVTINDTSLHLYGITNVYYTPTFDLANKFEPDSERYSILLAHIQNFDKFASFGIDLSLCGDTHGGMIRLPFVGAVYTPDGGVFPELSGNLIKGMYQKNGKRMFITSGLGNYPLPIRFCNRPEIAVLKLKPNK